MKESRKDSKKKRTQARLPESVPMDKISYPVIVRRPFSAYWSSLCLIIPCAAAMILMAKAVLEGQLATLSNKTMIELLIFNLMWIAGAAFGVIWFLSYFLVKVTIPDRNHIRVRTWLRSGEYSIFEVHASIIGDTAAKDGYLLVLKSPDGKVLCSLESRAKNWNECRSVFIGAQDRLKASRFKQMLLEGLWYSPSEDNRPVFQYIPEEDTSYIFVSDERERAEKLMSEPHEVKGFTAKYLVEIAREADPDNWRIFFNTSIGKYYIQEDTWEKATGAETVQERNSEV